MKFSFRFRSPRIQIDPLDWPLAAGAALARYHGWREPLSLWGDKPTPRRKRQARRHLRKQWDIKRAKNWVETAEWLLEEGQRLEFQREIQRWLELEEGAQAAYLTEVDEGKANSADQANSTEVHARLAWVQFMGSAALEQSFMGWDLLRLIDLSRWALRAGYADEAEAVSFMLAAAQVMQQRAPNFVSVYQQYLAGWKYWSEPDFQKKKVRLERAIRYWQRKRKGPWQKIPWDWDQWERDL